MSNPLGNLAELPTLHEGGQFISAKVSRVVELIREYSNGELDVQWVPPAQRDEGIAAFRIVHTQADGSKYLVMTVPTEEEFDERVLKRIIAGDQRNGSLQLSDLDAWDMAQKMVQQRAYEDEIAEANDIAYHVLRSHKNTYKVNDQLVFKEHGPQMFNL